MIVFIEKPTFPLSKVLFLLMLRSRTRSPARRSRHDSGDLIHAVREERRKRERRSRRSRSRSRSRSPRSRRGRSRSKKRHSNSKSSSRSRSNSRASGDDKEKNKKEKSKDTSEKKEKVDDGESKVSTANSFIFDNCKHMGWFSELCGK